MLRTLFPPLCYHCHQLLDRHQLLCKSCRELLDILPVVPQETVVTFEGEGPAWSLMLGLKSGRAPRLADGLAGYMALQYLQASLPAPDFIVPVPQSFFRSWQIGYNPALLLAEQIGQILKKPILLALKRGVQLLRQMRLEGELRHHLPSVYFKWNGQVDIAQKTILLIDDVVGTGATLKCCTQRLREGFPRKIVQMAAVRQMVDELIPAIKNKQ